MAKDGPTDRWIVHRGDCLKLIKDLADASVDSVVTDPPYPGISRDYGKWTPEQWRELMDPLIEQIQRVLKPTGSAVFILQPNSDRVGKMRNWLWQFMADWGWRWNIIQDAWWWNPTTAPNTHTQRRFGLMRTSTKACVWMGPQNCYRCQEEVLWTASDSMRAGKYTDRCDRKQGPSGVSVNKFKIRKTVAERGGSTPFNLLPIPGHSELHGHTAATPLRLASWWIRYITPKGGTVLDPFCGSGTMGIAALDHGCDFIGIERKTDYAKLARRRLKDHSKGAL